ncbi:GNAT family N-acetyltransferase [Catellatospora sp. NPDC049609]|uniref:GNAT family N-acetyltransferase n=1 Tax=Catellatospora sp. NPDC049609 TaxID=3155505 RepID=UPI00341C953A
MRIERERTGGAVSRALRREFVGELAARYPEQDFSADSVTDELPVLDAPGSVWLVVYDRDEAVGCGGLRGLDEHTGEIKWVYLRASARGRGLGRALLAELEDAARGLGYRRVRLSTGDRQPEALQLYLSAGYLPVDDGLPVAHRLEKDLG